MVTPNDPTFVVSSKPCQSAQTRKALSAMRNASGNYSPYSAQFGHESKALYAKELYLIADSTFFF